MNEITKLPAYERLLENFVKKGYSLGISDNTISCYWDGNTHVSKNITLGQYIGAISYGRITFDKVPKKFRTREFFLHTLSDTQSDIVDYVKAHPKKFDRQFFKDHIETTYYSLSFENNDFEYMPLEYIDEELISCAMIRSIQMRYLERRGDCENWFYSVYKRKPELLTKDFWILGARCFASKVNDVNRFLDITPDKYKTEEYYFALCQRNNTKVMEDIPESILTPAFLRRLLDDNIENIRCFSDSALEKETKMQGKGTVKFWQMAIIEDGYQVESIPLNKERIKFFLSLYNKSSPEFRYGFKKHYDIYLSTITSIDISELEKITKAASNNELDRNVILPIRCSFGVPKKYSEKFNKEEYLFEVYKKIGITIVKFVDYFYYKVILPDGFSVLKDDTGYCIKNAKGKTLIHYYEHGSIDFKTVNVDKVYVDID